MIIQSIGGSNSGVSLLLFIVICLAGWGSAWAQDMGCEEIRLAGKTFRYYDMEDDAEEVASSWLFGRATSGVRFSETSTAELSSELTWNRSLDFEVTGLRAWIDRSPRSRRCRLNFSGRIKKRISGESSTFQESFEVIARIGVDTLWLGDTNKEGGEIFFYLEVPAQQVSTRRFSPDAVANLQQRTELGIREISRFGGRPAMREEFIRYEREYLDGVNRPSRGFPMSRSEWFDEIKFAEVVLYSDYHGVRPVQAQAQDILVAMASSTVQKPNHSLALVLEWLDESYHPLIEAYYRDQIELSEILDRVRTLGHWEFSLGGYADLLETAKGLGVRVVLSEDFSRDLGLGERDDRVIAAMAKDQAKHPGSRYLVFYGAYHITGHGHLSDKVKKAGLGKPLVIITYADAVFWRGLQAFGDLEAIRYLRLDRETIFTLTETPWERTERELLEVEDARRAWYQTLEELEA